MKKTIVFFITLISLINPVFAYCDYMGMCPQLTPEVSSSTSQMLSNITGSNFLAEQAIQNLFKNELKKYTGINFEVTAKALSVNDTLSGKLKSLEIKGNNVIIEGLRFSSIRLKTLCPYNHINLNARPIGLKQNAVVGLWAEMNAQDIVQSLYYKDNTAEISKIDLSEIGINSFKIYPDTIKIENNKLYFNINAKSSGWYKAIDIPIAATIKIQSGNILASRFEFLNLNTGFDVTSLPKLNASLNNLQFELPIFGKNFPSSKVQILDIIFSGNKVYFYAMGLIPRTYF